MSSIRLLLSLFLISLSSSEEPDVCVTGSDHDYLDGVYVWQFDINSNPNGAVYYCSSCSVNVYLYPYIYGTGEFEWRFGSDYTSGNGWGSCFLGYWLGSDYHFDLSVCVGDWDYWSGSSWVNDNNMVVENCPTPNPTPVPTTVPTPVPTPIPTPIPTVNPSENPTVNPSLNPTQNPSMLPSEQPSINPTQLPTPAPSNNPTPAPTVNNIPTTKAPTIKAIAPTSSPNMNQLTTLESDQTSTRYISNGTQNESGAEFWDVIGPILAVIILCVCSVIACYVYKFRKVDRDGIMMDKNMKASVELNTLYTIPTQAVVQDQGIATDVMNKDDGTPTGISNYNIDTNTNTNILNDDLIINENIINLNIPNNIKILRMKQNNEVEEWINNVCRLPQYFNCFIMNGYESLEIIQETESIDELLEIGIMKMGHRTKIWSEIKKLKKNHDIDDYNAYINGNNNYMKGSFDQEIIGNDDDKDDDDHDTEGNSEDITDPPTDEGDINDDINDNNRLFIENDTNGNFKQSLGDKVLGNQMLMDDIIDNVDRTPQ